MPTPDIHKAVKASKLLLRGESMIASAGLAMAGILLMICGGAGAWTIYTQRQAATAELTRDVESWAGTLAASAEPILEATEDPARQASKLRTLVVNFAAEHRLKACRIVTPDGHVLADNAPGKVTVRRADSPGAALPLAEPLEPSPALFTAGAPLRLPDGEGKAEVAAAFSTPTWLGRQVQAGLGVIGAAGFAAFLLVYRRLRTRLRAIGAIREALLAMERGETASEALAVSAKLGFEAGAWNQLLAERERLRKELVSERARESLSQRGDLKQDLAHACDALWQGLLLVDEDLNIKYANGASAVFLQAKREELPASSLLDHLMDQTAIDAIRSVAAGQVRRKTTLEVRRAEAAGGGVLRFSVRPVRRDDTAAAVIMIEDITQQRIADEARNAYVAQATHELRTPLTNIRLYVEQAIEAGDSDQVTRARCLNVINQESRRLERIVGDMLSVSEIEAGSFKLRAGDVRLDALFEELEEDFKAQGADKGITLTFDMPPKLPVIQGDRDKIALAMHNLLGNALKYTPEGGSVTVRVASAPGALTVEVIDTGIGIAPEESELIFERFYRSRDKRVDTITGTGLGLALAREVIRLHGGDIGVRSQINQGSTFTLTLPVLAEAA
jgi:signal transduction histidine kinase